MIFHTIMNHLKMTVAGVGILMLTSCNGIFDDIYDLSLIHISEPTRH